jgi:hypothetical protein
MPDVPGPLDWLLQRLSRLIAAATDALAREYPGGVDAWQETVARQLARYSGAAMLSGAGVDTLTPAMTTAVTADLATQLGFLEQFGITIASGKEWQNGWNARAQMYAGGIKAPYWQGATKMLPLPAMPGDGTSNCLTRCGCQWSIDQLEGENNYDCTWVMSDKEHCQICRQRAADWAPLQVRDGRLQT